MGERGAVDMGCLGREWEEVLLGYYQNLRIETELSNTYEFFNNFKTYFKLKFSRFSEIRKTF